MKCGCNRSCNCVIANMYLASCRGREWYLGLWGLKCVIVVFGKIIGNAVKSMRECEFMQGNSVILMAV